MYRLLLISLLLTSLQAQEITIAVSANVSYAIERLITAFNKTHPETKVQVILGSSGKLTAQIQNGAPYGLFLSADMAYPERLYKKNIAITVPKVYAQGTLAFFSTKVEDFEHPMELLISSEIRKIAVGNPKTAPYGRATQEALQKAKVYKKIKDKLIYGGSISQTLSYAMTAADMGIVATSALYSPKMSRYKEHQNWVSVDKHLYKAIDQGVVLLKYAQEKKGYREFYDFILSSKAKKIFKTYGYIVK